MKFLLISVLIAFSSFNSETEPCKDLTYDIKLTHTSGGQDNGIIEVTITKSASKVKTYLYSEGKTENKLDVKLDELTRLKAGTYMLVLQNDICYAVKRDIIIK